MGIESIINNTYMWLFVASLFIVSFNIIGFLEKVKKKLKTYEDSLTVTICEKYLSKQINAEDTIKIYDFLVKRDEIVNQVKTNINSNLWAGIIFLISCIIGFALKQTDNNDTIAIILLGVSGFFLAWNFISLLYWYVKN